MDSDNTDQTIVYHTVSTGDDDDDSCSYVVSCSPKESMPICSGEMQRAIVDTSFQQSLTGSRATRTQFRMQAGLEGNHATASCSYKLDTSVDTDIIKSENNSNINNMQFTNFQKTEPIAGPSPPPPTQHQNQQGGAESLERFPEALRDVIRLMDPSQRLAACFDINVPLLIQAGAGSGKTQTMASRIAFLLVSGVPAHSILGICFTRQAAETLRQRVQAVLPPSLQSQTRLLKLKTLHAFGLECLRRFSENGGELDVYDSSRQRELAKHIVNAYAPDVKSSEAVEDLIEYINITKTKKELPLPQLHPAPGRQSAYLFSNYYEPILHEEKNAVDFGDLQRLFYELLRPLKQHQREEAEVSARVATASSSGGSHKGCYSAEEVAVMSQTATEPSSTCQTLRALYTHIIVDEFQDFNEVQLEILSLLAGDACRVTCVGDPNQCIYGWRGAMPNVFLAFKKRFPQTEMRVLGVNYRSDREIVLALNKLVQTEQESFHERHNRKVSLYRCEEDIDACNAVPIIIEKIIRARNANLSYDDIAILCRKRKGVSAFVELLRDKHIPVNELKGVAPDCIFVVKALLAYLRLCLNPHSDTDVRAALCCGPIHINQKAAKDLFCSLESMSKAMQQEENASVVAWRAINSLSNDSHNGRVVGASPSSYSFYSIISEAVYHNFSDDVVPKLATLAKSAQKILKQFVALIVEAQAQLNAPACDVGSLIQFISMKGGFDVQASKTRVATKRARSPATGATLAASVAEAFSGGAAASCSAVDPSVILATATAGQHMIGGDSMYTAEEERRLVEEAEMSISQLLMCAYQQVVGSIQHDDAAHMGPPTARTILRRVLDQFATLVPSDDFGPLHTVGDGGNGADSNSRRGSGGGGVGSVTVCTVHRAKGMEWPAVVLPECWLGNFPVRLNAEEKRVFYVAMSRAMTDLVLVTAGKEDPITVAAANYSGMYKCRPDVAAQHGGKLIETPYLKELDEDIEEHHFNDVMLDLKDQ